MGKTTEAKDTEKKQAEQALRESQERLELVMAQAEQLRRLAIQLDAAAQEERQKLAQQIHGQLQQLLTAAIIRLNLLGTMLEAENSRQLQADILEILDQAVDETRALTAQLNPPVLRRTGFAPVLAWLGDWLKEKYNLTVQIKVEGDPEPASRQLKSLLLEAVRELLLNVVKHAQVDTASVSLQPYDPDHWLLRVEDRGVGYDLAQHQAKSNPGQSFGLYGRAERLRLLGCRVHYQSAPGQGFRAEIIVPGPLDSSFFQQAE
jgi:signal transduction histidine kinase